MKKVLMVLAIFFSACLFFSCENAMSPSIPSVDGTEDGITSPEIENPDGGTKPEIIGTHSFDFTITANPKGEATELPTNFGFSHEIIYVQLMDRTGAGLEASLNIQFDLPKILDVAEGSDPFKAGAQNITATIKDYASSLNTNVEHMTLGFNNDETITKEQEFSLENNTAIIDLKMNAVDFEQRGKIEIELAYDSTVYKKLPKKIIVLAYSKGSLVQESIVMNSLIETVENPSVDVDLVPNSDPLGWNILINDTLDNSMNNDYTSSYALDFLGVRKEYPVTLTVKNGNTDAISINNVVAFNELGNAVFSFDLKHSKITKASDCESSVTLTVDVKNSSDSEVYKGLPFDIVINTKRDYEKQAICVSNISEDNNSVEITSNESVFNLAILDEEWVTAKEDIYSVPVTVNLDGYIDSIPLKLTPKNSQNISVIQNNAEVTEIPVNSSTTTFTVVHTGKKLLEDTVGTIQFDLTADSDYVYADLPKTITINTNREKTLNAYASLFDTSNETDNSGNSFTQINLPSVSDENVTLNYSVLRKDDSSNGNFTEIANGAFDIIEGLSCKADNCDVLRVIPEYKVVLTTNGISVETKSIQHIHTLTTKQIALAVMESIRHGLIDEKVHYTDVAQEHTSSPDDAFKQKRIYWSGAVAYKHEYSLSNYKPYFINISGAFEYAADVAGYGDAGRNSIDTVNSWWIHGKAPFTGTLNFTSPYGNGKLVFNSVNIANNNKNSPSWKNGSISVTLNGITETYSNSNQIPFGFYMDEETFDKAIVGQGSDGKKKVYFSSFDSNKSAMYTYALTENNEWAVEVNENIDAENTSNKDYTATLTMHFDGVHSSYPLIASVSGTDETILVSNIQRSAVSNGQQSISFDVTVDSEADSDRETKGTGVKIIIEGDTNIYSDSSLPLELSLHGSRLEKKIPVNLSSITEVNDSLDVGILNSSTDTKTEYTVKINDKTNDTAQLDNYTVPLIFNFPEVRSGLDIALEVVENSAQNITVDIEEIDSGKQFIVNLKHTTPATNAFTATNGEIVFEVTTDNDRIYEGLPQTIKIKTERLVDFSVYAQSYVNSFTTTQASANLSEGGKYYTQISIPAHKLIKNGSPVITYKLYRSDDAAANKLISEGIVDTEKGIDVKDFDALMLKTEPTYKIELTCDSTVTSIVKTGTRQLSNKELALAAMVTIREGTRQTHSDKNKTVNAGGGSFKHSRKYYATVSYGHTYSLNNYKTWFMKLNGSFHYISDDESNTNINSCDKWSGLGKTTAPFTGTINISSPYGNGSIKLDSININNNDKNNPSWKNGSLVVTGGGKTQTYGNNSGIPFGFYMDYATFLGKIAPSGNYTQK